MADFIPDNEFSPDSSVGKPIPNASDHPPGNGSNQPDFIPDSNFVSDEDKYGTLGEKIKTGLEGAASAATFGASTAAERALGVNPTDIRLRAETNPISHTVGEIGGLAGSALILPGAGAAGVLGKAGKAAASSLGLGAEGAGLLGRVAAGATQLGTETAIMQAGDEFSKFITEDPNQSVGSAMTDIGLSGLFGAGAGAAFGSVSPLWKATKESKLGQMVHDFKARIKEHLQNPNPVDQIAGELSGHYNTTKEMADEVYGAQGLKEREIQALIPDQMTEKMTSQAQDVYTKVTDALTDIKKNPDEFPNHLAKQFERQANRFQEVVTNTKSTPADVFESIQRVKQFAQDMSKGFVKQIEPEYGFVSKMRSIGPELKTALEDPSVWGNAADRQQAINKAFREFLPAQKDFEKRFTTIQGNERVVDPGKINTYVNQIGKPNAELKQSMLKEYLDASDRYRSVISDTHTNLGLENPFPVSEVTASRTSLGKLSAGAKVADALIKKSAARVAGEATGTVAGAMVGHPAIGYMFGEHALTPMFNSVLPALIKPFLEKGASGEAAKAAFDMGAAMARGETLIKRSAKSVFLPSSSSIASVVAPSPENREKLKDKISEYNANPEKMMNVAKNVGYYMPDHGAAFGATATRAVQYLNSLKPNTHPLGPLDTKRTASKFEEAKYNRAIDVAEQPLLVIKSIKSGTLTPQDVVAVQTVHPGFYDRMSQKLHEEMINHIASDGVIPYHTRLSLSLFLNQPLDASMTQQSIMSSQPQISMAQSQQPQGGTRPRGQMKNLGKSNFMAQTPLQSRESDRLSHGT